ncbi:MAG: matrixin family metalloprotease [Gemmatimonadetes bacterium]|nr:matrixin family metalloprotease [Gemmatimonadota bacterium]
MKIRLAPSVAILSVLGFATWLALNQPVVPESEQMFASPDELAALQEQTRGSAVPCEVPLHWRIARVDDPFGLTQAEASEAVRRAAALWEEAVGRTLFTNNATSGFPIRFVYDDRQASAQERRRFEEAYDRTSAGLERRRVELNDLRERTARMRSQLEQRLRDHQGRTASYNDTVRGWNQRGDASDEVRAQLRASARTLEAGRLALSEETRQLETLQRRLQDEEESFNRELQQHARRRAAIERAFPGTRVESGGYREAVHTQEGRIVSAEREIRIYRFDGPNDLLLVIAHELGHALGLGHATVPDAVMSEEYRRAATSAAAPRIQPSDLELLRSRCPDLR